MSIPNYITPDGLKKLQDELQQLLHVDRPSVVKTVTWAAENGDRSENADYIYGKKRLREIDKRVRFLQGRLDNIDCIDPKTQKTDVIKFGATVTIEDDDGKTQVWQIVGVDEIDLSQKKISWQSPLAKALMGKKVGQSAVVQRPKEVAEVYIVAVEYK